MSKVRFLKNLCKVFWKYRKMASNCATSMRNESTHWKKLLLSSLLLLGVPNIIVDKVMLPFLKIYCSCWDTCLQSLLIFFIFLCTHSSSCRESIRDVGTHPMTPKQCLEHRLIFEDERGKVLSKNCLVMNELRQKWSVDCMNTPTRYTIAKRFGKTALNFLYHSRFIHFR